MEAAHSRKTELIKAIRQMEDRRRNVGHRIGGKKYVKGWMPST